MEQPQLNLEDNMSLETAVGTGVYEWRPADDRLTWSPGLLQIYGLAEPPRGEAGFSALVHPEDRVRVEAETSDFLGSGDSTYSHAFRIVRPDGEVRHVLDRGVIERDAQGVVLAMRGMNIDLTDLPRPAPATAEGVPAKRAAPTQRLGRRENETARGEIEALYAEAPLGLGLLDRDLRFVRINHALAETNGFTVEEHLGRCAWDLVPGLRESAEAALRRVLESGIPLRDVVVKGETPARPGALREWREHFYPLHGADGAVCGIGIVCEEVTECVAAAHALAESERRFRLALAQSPITVFEHDRELRYEWMYNAKLGYSDTFCIGKTDDEIMDPAAAAVLTNFKRSVLASGEPARREVTAAAPGRPMEHYDLYVHPRRDAAGHINGVTCVATDITEKKLAEVALRESEARFRNMADNAPVIVWLTEADGTCTYLSRSWYDFTGQTEKTGLGLGWLTSVHPEDAAESERIFLDANARQKPFRLDCRIRRADGVYRWAIDSAQPRVGPDGEFLGFIGSVIDITERKEAEEKLRAAHDTFRQLVDRSPFGIYAVNADFRLVQVSDGARKVFSNVHPLIGRNFAEVLHIIWPEPFASDAVARFRHTLETGAAYHAPGTSERRADTGEKEAYDWKIERITMPDGRPGVVCHFYDLSERQAHEEKIRTLMNEVNHRVKNMLALVNAVARQTAAASPDDFLERFGARLRALAASQDLLVQAKWEGADLAALVKSQLLHFQDLLGSRIMLEGPPVEVSPHAAQPLGMALHELATNAAKYGALSNRNGRVGISWRIGDNGGHPQFSITWREEKGPRVSAPARSGFGSRVAMTMVEAELSAKVALDYAETGVVWTLRCPLSEIGRQRNGAGS